MASSGGVCIRGRAELNRYACEFIEKHGDPQSFAPLSGDLSVCGDLLVVPHCRREGSMDIRLSPHIEGVETLRCELTEQLYRAQADGTFKAIPSGVWRHGRSR